jgi:hypothetical protein
MKDFLRLTWLIILVSGPVYCADRQYVVSAIDCEESCERYIDDAYAIHIHLLSGKTIPKGALRLPSKLVRQSDSFLIFERAYYVTPNSLRGFSLAIPRSLMAEKDGIITNLSPIRAVKEDWKQGIALIECGGK